MSNTIGSKPSNVTLGTLETMASLGNDDVIQSDTLPSVMNGGVEEVDFSSLLNLSPVNAEIREEKMYYGDNSYINTKYDGDIKIIQESVENGVLRDYSEYYPDGTLKSMSIYDENGNLIQTLMYNEDGTLKSLARFNEDGTLIKFDFTYDGNGNITSGTCNGQSIDIFGNYNLASEQYGGSQMSFTYNAGELLQDGVVLGMLKECFPDASMEDYQLYLNKITNVGCGYVAQVNTLFKAYEGREQEFLNTFGYPMYTVDSNGSINFNYEYVVIDYVNSTYGNSGYTIEQLYGSTDGTATDAAVSGNTGGVIEGIHPTDTSTFTNFLKSEYGVAVKGDSTIYGSYADVSGVGKVVLNFANSFLGGGSVIEHYQNNYSSSDQVIICTEGFDMYTYDSATGGRGEITGSNVGAHGMSITGVTAGGDFIVSSWGKKYVIGLENVQANHGSIVFQGYDY